MTEQDLAAIEATYQRTLTIDVDYPRALMLALSLKDVPLLVAEVRRLRAALVELRARMTDPDHPAERRTNWARAPQRWVALVDAALAGGEPT